MKIRATDDREYWTRKRLCCAACGETARHYLASWDRQNAPEIFAVPYAALNGGIGREVGVPEDFPDQPDLNECELYLSECCDTPFMGTMRFPGSGQLRPPRVVFHSVAYQCRAQSWDDEIGVRCRLNAHPADRMHLGPHETPDRRDQARVWTTPK